MTETRRGQFSQEGSKQAFQDPCQGTVGETPFKGIGWSIFSACWKRVQHDKRRAAWLFDSGPTFYIQWHWRRHVLPIYWAAALYQAPCRHMACMIDPHAERQASYWAPWTFLVWGPRWCLVNLGPSQATLGLICDIRAPAPFSRAHDCYSLMASSLLNPPDSCYQSIRVATLDGSPSSPLGSIWELSLCHLGHPRRQYLCWQGGLYQRIPTSEAEIES